MPGRKNGAGGVQRLHQHLGEAEEILSLEVFLKSPRCCQANIDTEEEPFGFHRSWFSELLLGREANASDCCLWRQHTEAFGVFLWMALLFLLSSCQGRVSK